MSLLNLIIFITTKRMDKIKEEIINHDDYSDFLVKTRDSFSPDSFLQLQDNEPNLKSEITLQEIKVEKLDIEEQFTDENESLYNNINDRETEKCIPNDSVKEEEIQPQEFNTFGYSEANCNESIKTNSNELCNIVEKDGSLFKCKLCGLEAVREYYIKFHYERMHSKRKFKNFWCDLCNYTATERYLMRTHKMKHMQAGHLKQKSYTCQLCHFVAADNSELRSHISSVHVNDRNYKCTLCDYAGYLSSNLKLHMKRQHREFKK